MAFIAVSGEPGCRHEELAHLAAQRFQCKLITEADLARLVAIQYGETAQIADRSWRARAAFVLAGLGSQQHVVVCCSGAEMLSEDLPSVFSFHVVAPEAIRLANISEEYGIGRAKAKARLRAMASVHSEMRKRRFGQKISPITRFDLVVNGQAMDAAAMLDLLDVAVRSLRLMEDGSLPEFAAAKAQAKRQLARYGRAPGELVSDEPVSDALTPACRVELERKTFGHPSEEVFANLLDFYRITWDYEPRSFPLQWDKDGKVLEAFTPDFYLPEYDLYVELTTMKQANVTRKNRKIRMLRAIYPHVNIQVFYQKDVQDLVMKYRLPERLARRAVLLARE